MQLCDYGCGQEAKYQFKNRKWCCNKIWQTCPSFGKKISTLTSGENNPNYGNKYSIETRNKIRVKALGRKPWNKGIPRKLKTKKNLSEKLKGREPWNKGINDYSNRRTIEMINEKSPLFSKIEEMRYNPEKPIEEKEIQVHCKNNKCKNSKEKNGWFTPTGRQVEARLSSLELHGTDNSYFYCSQECKDECILYNLQSDPYKEKKELVYTQEELQVFNEKVKELDKGKCQMCGTKKYIQVHHIIPKKLEPYFALDPINGICFCKKCHYKYGHKDECNTWNLANKICNT